MSTNRMKKENNIFRSFVFLDRCLLFKRRLFLGGRRWVIKNSRDMRKERKNCDTNAHPQAPSPPSHGSFLKRSSSVAFESGQEAPHMRIIFKRSDARGRKKIMAPGSNPKHEVSVAVGWKPILAKLNRDVSQAEFKWKFELIPRDRKGLTSVGFGNGMAMQRWLRVVAQWDRAIRGKFISMQLRK